MLILGIDPGSVNLGWGLIEENHKGAIIREYGCIHSKSPDPQERLAAIYNGVNDLIQKYQPDCVCVEKLFFGANAKTAMAIGEARGVILLSAKQAAVAVSEYTPLEIKMAITGYGRAEKMQVQSMVKKYLGLSKTPKPSHAADALAVAICHLNSQGMKKKINEAVSKGR